MSATPYTLIVGVGAGLSASLARVFARDGGFRIALASRHPEKFADLARELNAASLRCDAADHAQVKAMFDELDRVYGEPPHVVIYNAASRTRGPITEIDPEAAAQTLFVSAFGALLVAQQAAQRMLRRGSGVLLFTGASASVKGFARSAPFAMGKFALRGLAQSLARELAPQGIHVAHVVIDGAIRRAGDEEVDVHAKSQLDPDAIARNYLHLAQQDRSAWSSELALRPWVEPF